MSVRFLFSIGCVIMLAGLAGSLVANRYAARIHADSAALIRIARFVIYVGAAVAALAMITGLIIG